MHNRGRRRGGGTNFFIFIYFKFKAKMHFWSIYFVTILVLVPKFYSRLH